MSVTVLIRQDKPFYSLYADGPFASKTFDSASGDTTLTYDKGSVIALYYKYPAWREACVVRASCGDVILPGVTGRVRLLFSVRASRVDHLRRSIGFLHKNCQGTGGAFERDDGFYIRLSHVLSLPGKINYGALRLLAEKPANIFSPSGVLK